MLTLERFDAVCAAHAYQPKGMFYSEVFLFLMRCQHHAVDLIIESGVKFGMSTRLLASAWQGEIISIDQKPLSAAIAGVQILAGDSLKLLPQLLDERPERRVGVLIDGPKGKAALGLKAACLQRAGCRLVAVHDAERSRTAAAHSWDTAFQRSDAQRLDRFVSAEYRAKYPAGPGLSIWEKP